MTNAVFVLSHSLRHGALATIDPASDSGVATAASIAAEQLLRQRAFGEGMEVALLGKRWRIASQAARLAFAHGELSFEKLISIGASRIPYREGMKDPLFALVVALGAGNRLAASARAELLGFAAVSASRAGESDEDDLLHPDVSFTDASQERRLWGALIALMSRRLLEDWPGLAVALTGARNTLTSSSKPVLARAGALRSMLTAQIELGAALLGQPSRHLVEEHLRLSTALEESDQEAALSAIALASAIRGDINTASQLLDRKCRGRGREKPASPQQELACAVVAVERSAPQLTPWSTRRSARELSHQAGLEDLHIFIEARANYLTQSTGMRALEQLTALARRVDGLPWAVAQATAFRVEMLLTNGHLAQAFRANEEAQRGPFASWPVMRLALAKIRYAQNQTEAASRIAESVWISGAVSLRERARAYAIGAACALRLGDTRREESLVRELRWLSEEAGLSEAFDEMPDGRRSQFRPAERSRLRPGLPEPSEPMQLTSRERTVLAALSEHTSAEEIAVVLQVSRNTVKTQLRHVYRKLSAHTREEALRAAADNGLI